MEKCAPRSVCITPEHAWIAIKAQELLQRVLEIYIQGTRNALIFTLLYSVDLITRSIEGINTSREIARM